MNFFNSPWLKAILFNAVKDLVIKIFTEYTSKQSGGTPVIDEAGFDAAVTKVLNDAGF